MRIFALGVTILLLAACGQKGPLYIPAPTQTPSASDSPAQPIPQTETK